MGSWTIYNKNGVAKAVVKELELHDEWMAECFLTLTINSATPIQFAVGDYIDYRNERYTIEYDPNVIKRATSGTYGEGFVYDGIKFLGSQDEIVRCDFNDIVLSDNNVHYTALPMFPFYCESVDDLLDRIQANLEDLYPNQWIVIGLNTVRNSQRGSAVGRQTAFENAYKQWVDPDMTPNTEPYGKQSVAESADNITCWDALTKVHDDFGLNFIVRGKVVVVGTAGVFTSNTFRYGKGNGLEEIEKIGDSSQQIVTRLRAYGSENNLPSHYYSAINMLPYGNVVIASTTGLFELDIAFKKDYFVHEFSSGETDVVAKIGDTSYNAKAFINGVSGNININVLTAVSVAANSKVYITDGVKRDMWPSDHKDYTEDALPENMAVSRLMLPMFPNVSLYDWVKAHRDADTDYNDATGLATYHGITAYFSKEPHRPYIDSLNKALYGARPASIYFDGNNDTVDIHPTIEGMTYNNIRIDAIYSADQIEDSGVYDDSSVEVSNFHITLPDLGFDLAEVYEENASIDMKDGMCGGRSFKLASKPTQDSNGRWVCEVQREKDENLNLFFPYCDFQITSGDHYVLTGIQMPDAYIEAAAVKLLGAALDALQKNEAPRFTYQPKIDKNFMQRQHDTAMSSQGVVSLHDTLKAGDVFVFADADMGVDASIIIDILTIKENGDNGIPTYEITLREEKQVSTIQKIQNKVDSVISGAININGVGAGFSQNQLQSLIYNYGGRLFLSKINKDKAQEIITFEKGIESNGIENDEDLYNRGDAIIRGKIIGDELTSNQYSGDGMLDTGFRLWYEEGRSKLVIDDLVARGKFTVNELETRIWTYAGGNMIFSGAGSTIFFVEYLDSNNNTLGYTHINQPWLLRGRALLAGALTWSKRRNMLRKLNDTEKAQVAKFRCYEYSDDGTMQTRNWWHPNDIAMCQTFNRVKNKVQSGTPHTITETDPLTGEQTTVTYYSQGSASNTTYKRRVAGVGSKKIPTLNDDRIYDYVDLWNIYDVQGETYIDTDGTTKTIADTVKGFLNMAASGQTPSTDWPVAGDVIVQCGNPLDTDRQSMVTIEVQGDVHGFKVYDTINDYSMENKLWVEIGYDKDGGKAKANIFGDFRFGHRPTEQGSYISYNRTTGILDVKAKINVLSTIGDTDLPDYVKAPVLKYAHDLLNGVQSPSGDAETAANVQHLVLGALNGGTFVDGGLLLTSLIGLRHNTGTAQNPNYVTYGGMNGVYDSTLQGKTIAAWFGGSAIDHEADVSAQNYAQSLLRFDGSGYFAGGNISWDESGNCKYAGEITAQSGIIGGFKIGTDYIGEYLGTNADSTYIHKDGLLRIRNTGTGLSDYAIDAYGNISLTANSGQKVVFATGGTGEIYINGKVFIAKLGGSASINKEVVVDSNGFLKVQ